ESRPASPARRRPAPAAPAAPSVRTAQERVRS
ncbi:ABC transporter permease, partial [Streptomyces sp. SID7909]|nr:ABC transporter permease [Streptomyces sp. SID7909]